MKNFLYYLAHSAGQVLLKYFRKDIKIIYKDKNNPVTKADKEAEHLLKKLITKKFPEDKFICEESCQLPGKLSPETRYWIIDPLDGTVNYIHGLPIFSVSIGVMESNKIISGIVYNPFSKEIFFAQKGKGAYRNDKKIKVSKTKDINKAFLVTGFPYYTHKNPINVFKLFNSFSTKAEAVRRLGSAALDICNVASGIFDGYWEENLQAWDVAAGSIILTEAGGRLTDFNCSGNYLFGKQLIASNNKIHKAMCKFINQEKV